MRPPIPPRGRGTGAGTARHGPARHGRAGCAPPRRPPLAAGHEKGNDAMIPPSPLDRRRRPRRRGSPPCRLPHGNGGPSPVDPGSPPSARHARRERDPELRASGRYAEGKGVVPLVAPRPGRPQGRRRRPPGVGKGPEGGRRGAARAVAFRPRRRARGGRADDPARRRRARGAHRAPPGARQTIAVGGLALPYRDASAFALSLEKGRQIPRAPSDVVAIGTPA